MIEVAYSKYKSDQERRLTSSRKPSTIQNSASNSPSQSMNIATGNPMVDLLDFNSFKEVNGLSKGVIRMRNEDFEERSVKRCKYN